MSGPWVAVWVCSDPEARWIADVTAAQAAEYGAAEDRRIELELGRWPAVDGWTEETDVELIPVELIP